MERLDWRLTAQAADFSQAHAFSMRQDFRRGNTAHAALA
ncbi:uncharacterized protein METZ01_LOCUS516970, partial [marine metagenome]